jgi:hypothetical protein
MRPASATGVLPGAMTSLSFSSDWLRTGRSMTLPICLLRWLN